MRDHFLRSQSLRVPPRSSFETVLTVGARIATVVLGIVALVYIMDTAQMVLAPVGLAVVIGLMFAPLVRRMERLGIYPALSAMVVVLLLLTILVAGALLFATPLSFWVEQIPSIWVRLKNELLEWREPLAVIGSLQEQIRSISGTDRTVAVTVDEGSTVTDIAFVAPIIVAQILIFLASLFFFVATRDEIRIATLSLCIDRRTRWRTAHIFRDVESDVSVYLLSITLINIGLGTAVAVAMWLIGLPSPILWGALAAVLNYIIFLGPAAMAAILLAAGLTVFDQLSGAIVPPLAFLAINLLEAQFVTPIVVGRRMTLNPFIVFLAVTFWLWLWGPVGGFVAVPFLLIIYAIGRNILPLGQPPKPARQNPLSR